MKKPNALTIGDTIGICAPSSGIQGGWIDRLIHAETLLNSMGYHIIETPSVRYNHKLVSADKETRAKEFMNLYLNPDVKVIIPPWGGEILMEMLPYLDFETIKNAEPKWVVGFSDLSTLLFTLTLVCDVMTVNGPNMMDFGTEPVDSSVLNLLEILKQEGIVFQKSLSYFQKTWGDFGNNHYVPYQLTEKVIWKSLDGTNHHFKGRLIGGCLDVICKLIGTPFAPVLEYLEKYKDDGIIWLIESVEMNASDIARTLWQMIQNGYFKYSTGILIGRPDGYSDVQDYQYLDALEQLNDLNVPVIYDVDYGHLPPQLTFINGAITVVHYENQQGEIIQHLE